MVIPETVGDLVFVPLALDFITQDCVVKETPSALIYVNLDFGAEFKKFGTPFGLVAEVGVDWGVPLSVELDSSVSQVDLSSNSNLEDSNKEPPLELSISRGVGLEVVGHVLVVAVPWELHSGGNISLTLDTSSPVLGAPIFLPVPVGNLWLEIWILIFNDNSLGGSNAQGG